MWPKKSLDIYKVVTTHSYIAFLGCYFGQDVAWPDGVTGCGETVYPERETERIVFDSEFNYDVCLFIYLFFIRFVQIVIIISDTFYFTGNYLSDC